MRPSYGSVAEWFKAAVLKTADSQGSQSSNLCASATFEAPFLRGFLLSAALDFKGRWASEKEEFRNPFGTTPLPGLLGHSIPMKLIIAIILALPGSEG